jgi:subtilase family serine protease
MPGRNETLLVEANSMLKQLTRGRRPVRRKRNNRWLAIQIERLEPLQLLTPLAGAISPQQISAAYGFNQVAFDGYTKVITRQGLKFVPYSIPGTGAGQTIAIIEIGIDPHIESDTNVFSKQYGLPTLNASNFTEYKAPGSTKDGSADPTGFAQETSIDVEWAHAIAPQAKILLVDEGSETNPLTSGLIDGVNYAANQPGVSVVSYSYGNSEFAGETLEDQYFTTPAGHTPVAFVAASGDSVPETPPNITTNWPAMSPEVLSVGGTYFTPNANGSLPANGAYVNEAAWGEGPGQGASNASGGGIRPF